MVNIIKKATVNRVLAQDGESYAYGQYGQGWTIFDASEDMYTGKGWLAGYNLPYDESQYGDETVTDAFDTLEHAEQWLELQFAKYGEQFYRTNRTGSKNASAMDDSQDDDGEHIKASRTFKSAARRKMTEREKLALIDEDPDEDVFL